MDHPAQGGGTAIVVHVFIDHYAVPVFGLLAAPRGYYHTPAVGDQSSGACGSQPLVHKTLNRVGSD